MTREAHDGFSPDWFEGWRRGDADSFGRAAVWLWDRLEPTVRSYVRALGRPDNVALDVSEKAYWAAMEELDLMIAEGRFLTVESDSKAGRRTCTVTARELSPREPMEWRGPERFVAFARRIWTLRALDAPVDGPEIDSDGDPSPEDLVYDSDWDDARAELECEARVRVIGVVRQLSNRRASMSRKPKGRELVGETIRYVAWETERCSPGDEQGPDRSVVAVPIDHLVADDCRMVAQLLYAAPDLPQLDSPRWHDFLMDRLFEQAADGSYDRKRNTLDVRIRRCEELAEFRSLLDGSR